MRCFTTLCFVALTSTAAMAQSAPPMPKTPPAQTQPTPDPNTQLTLTLGELNLLFNAEHAKAALDAASTQANPVLQKLQAQVAAAAPKAPASEPTKP